MITSTCTSLYYVAHGPVHFAGQDSIIANEDAHRTKSIVTEIVYDYIQHNT